MRAEDSSLNLVEHVQLNLDISNSDISNSAKLEASIWINNTFIAFSNHNLALETLLQFQITEVEINLHFGKFELLKNSLHNFEISRVDCICNNKTDLCKIIVSRNYTWRCWRKWCLLKVLHSVVHFARTNGKIIHLDIEYK